MRLYEKDRDACIFNTLFFIVRLVISLSYDSKNTFGQGIDILIF